jgi:hypothetical protein
LVVVVVEGLFVDVVVGGLLSFVVDAGGCEGVTADTAPLSGAIISNRMKASDIGSTTNLFIS